MLCRGGKAGVGCNTRRERQRRTKRQGCIRNAKGKKRTGRTHAQDGKDSPSTVALTVAPESTQIVVACLVGIITGASVVLFNDCVHLVQDAVEHIRQFPLLEEHRGAVTLLVPAAGGAAVTLIQQAAGGFEPTATRRGQHVHNANAWKEKAKPFLKSAAAVATLGTGASLGPEGPSVEIGTNCAALLFNSLRVSRRSKVPIIAAGSAAGLAAGFNAPIAGAFFAVEYVLQRSKEKGEYGGPSTSSTTIAMVLLSAVLAAVLSQIGLGSEPAFKLPVYEQIRLVELPLFMLLGVLAGATSSAFLQGSKWFAKLFEELEERGVPCTFHPAIGGFCTGAIALWYPQVLYAGFTNVNAILDASSGTADYTWYLLLQIALAKIVATCVCKSSGLVGGIYAPSLFLGAAVGCSYGSLALFGMSGGMHDFASFDSYAIVGMASMLAGICRVPLTSVLLMFELTRDYNILLPSLAAVGLSYWVASFSMPSSETPTVVGSSSADETEGMGPTRLDGLDREGQELSGDALCRLDSEECSPEWGMEEVAMRTVECRASMDRTVPVFDPSVGLVELGAQMLQLNVDCAALVERDTGTFVGLCTVDQVERSLTGLLESEDVVRQSETSTASALVASYPRLPGGRQVLSVPGDSSLERARTLMLTYDTDHLAVVESAGDRPVLLGVLRLADLRRACRQHVIRASLASLDLRRRTQPPPRTTSR